MRQRTHAREVALQYLYQIDITCSHTDKTLNEFFRHFVEAKEQDIIPFAQEIVEGVCEHLNQIDSLIEEASKNWKVSRMTTTDRNILRIATYEITFREDVPYKVAINEAIELAKKFGSPKFPSFANGVLDRIHSEALSQDKPS
jgi:transcription antitermination protein NusB